MFDRFEHYLKIAKYLEKRYTINGKLFYLIAGKPSKYSHLEKMAYNRYILKLKKGE